MILDMLHLIIQTHAAMNRNVIGFYLPMWMVAHLHYEVSRTVVLGKHQTAPKTAVEQGWILGVPYYPTLLEFGILSVEKRTPEVESK